MAEQKALSGYCHAKRHPGGTAGDSLVGGLLGPAFGGSHGAMARRVIRLAPGLPAHLARSVQVNVRLGKGAVGTELECNLNAVSSCVPFQTQVDTTVT